MSNTSRNNEVMKYCFGDDAEFVAVKHYERLQRELTEAQNILKQCLSIMPVGYIPTHTEENLPEMIGDLAKALAEETTEYEQLERELAEVRKQRDILETALMIIEGYYVHNESTYEDWKAMGQTAQNALSRITPI
jgi:predicted RNase H-like nuclease (RuvC/YqgF family)